jgi:hypothetical protein
VSRKSRRDKTDLRPLQAMQRVMRRAEEDAAADAPLADLAARGLLRCVCKQREPDDCICGARRLGVSP